MNDIHEYQYSGYQSDLPEPNHMPLTEQPPSQQPAPPPANKLLSMPKGLTKKFYVSVLLACMGGFLFGYDIGVLGTATLLIRNELNLSLTWQQIIIGTSTFSAAIFAFFSGPVNERLGRRLLIRISALIYASGSIFMAASAQKSLLMVGRVLIGIAIGMEFSTVPLYLAEISPSNIRGRIVGLNVAMIACGQLFGSIVQIFVSEHWRYMLGVGVVPAVIQFIGFILIPPESPRWLFYHEREQEGREALKQFRQTEEKDFEQEIKAMKENAEETRDEETSRTILIVHILRTSYTKRALIVGCGLQMFQQLAGITTIMYYNALIIKMAGIVNRSLSTLIQAITSLLNLSGTLVGLFFVERMGRRKLLLLSLLGAIISLIWLAFGFQQAAKYSPPALNYKKSTWSGCSQYTTCNECLLDLDCGFCYRSGSSGSINGSCIPTLSTNPIIPVGGLSCNDTSSDTWAYEYCPTEYSWIILTGLIFYLVSFAPGMSHIPWTINSEIYPLWARSTGNALATSTNWFFSLLMSLSFLTLLQILTRQGTFWLMTVFAVLGFVFSWLLVPEIKGLALEEVEGVFAKSWSAPQWWFKRVHETFASLTNRSPNTATSNIPAPGSDTHYVHIRSNSIEDEY